MLPSQNIDSSNYAGSKSLGLQRRLLEVAVVVGMDEETGLQCKHSDVRANVLPIKKINNLMVTNFFAAQFKC